MLSPVRIRDFWLEQERTRADTDPGPFACVDGECEGRVVPQGLAPAPSTHFLIQRMNISIETVP